MTWTEMAQAVGAEFGLRLTPEHADHLLWERTGFPSFWRSDDPIMECSNQLRSSFRRAGFDRQHPLRCFSKRTADAARREP